MGLSQAKDEKELLTKGAQELLAKRSVTTKPTRRIVDRLAESMDSEHTDLAMDLEGMLSSWKSTAVTELKFRCEP